VCGWNEISSGILLMLMERAWEWGRWIRVIYLFSMFWHCMVELRKRIIALLLKWIVAFSY